jgi:predicted transcriptional regulator
MGYRGKVVERERARELRAESWTLVEIARELGVARSSVSLWVRDVDFEPRPRARVARRRGPNALQRRKQAEIDELLADGRRRIGRLAEQEFLVAGTALYAGEGSKTPGEVRFVNTDPRMIYFFCHWLRQFFEVDESRMRVRLYLHEGLDLDAAVDFWSRLTQIPPDQFRAPYRAAADPSIRSAKHVNGCPGVSYSCTRTHRAVMGLVDGLLSCHLSLPG